MAEIRLLTDEDDIYAVSNVYEQSWKCAYAGIIPKAYLDSIPAGRWADAVRCDGRNSLVMYEDGKMIGTSAYGASRMENMPGYGEIISIYLLPQYMHRGYGKRLLLEALSKLRRMGYADVYLWVLEENKSARSFYEKHGFGKSSLVRQENIGGRDLRELQYIYRAKDMSEV